MTKLALALKILLLKAILRKMIQILQFYLKRTMRLIKSRKIKARAILHKKKRGRMRRMTRKKVKRTSLRSSQRQKLRKIRIIMGSLTPKTKLLLSISLRMEIRSHLILI